MEPESPQSSRERLLAAGKALFAKHGYEQTSTATISREALTSESQLIRNFGGKAGLLLEIFNEGWKPLNESVTRIHAESQNAREAIFRIITLLIDTTIHDPDFTLLLLFEGWRVRGEKAVALSRGFVEFYGSLRSTIRRAQSEGLLRTDYHDAALASALIGAAESMVRERLVARRTGQADPFTDADVQVIVSALAGAL